MASSREKTKGSSYELCLPVLEKLGFPLTFANSLKIKKEKIAGIFKNFGYTTIALGDSFNDAKSLEDAENIVKSIVKKN